MVREKARIDIFNAGILGVLRLALGSHARLARTLRMTLIGGILLNLQDSGAPNSVVLAG